MSAQFIYPSHPTLRKLCWTAFTSGGLRELALRTDELHLTFATLDQAQRFSARAASDFGDTKTVIKPPPRPGATASASRCPAGSTPAGRPAPPATPTPSATCASSTG
jgi:hypothetical protein